MGAESARADFNLQELPCYLNNTYETMQLLLKFIGKQTSDNFFVKGISCFHCNQISKPCFVKYLPFDIVTFN